MKVAITGSSGLVGSRVIELLNDNFQFLPIKQEEVDITDKQSVEKKLATMDYDIFLHLAAYTSVDGAEKERELAHKINVEGTRNVFETAKNMGKKFIFISTGFVFDGEHPPYYEESTPNPIGYYGMTKYDGERVVDHDGMIVRIEYPYRASFEPKKDFVRAIKTRLESGLVVNSITDSLMTPTFIDDIAQSLKHLMHHFSPEIIHIVGADCLSPYDAALAIAKHWHLDETLITKTTYAEYFQGKAARPKLADVRSRKNHFHKMKTFEEGLSCL